MTERNRNGSKLPSRIFYVEISRHKVIVGLRQYAFINNKGYRNPQGFTKPHFGKKSFLFVIE